MVRTYRVTTALDDYLLRTSKWRKTNIQAQHLLAHIKPNQEVLASKTSGWFKAILKLAGIDLDLSRHTQKE